MFKKILLICGLITNTFASITYSASTSASTSKPTRLDLIKERFTRTSKLAKDPSELYALLTASASAASGSSTEIETPLTATVYDQSTIRYSDGTFIVNRLLSGPKTFYRYREINAPYSLRKERQPGLSIKYNYYIDNTPVSKAEFTIAKNIKNQAKERGFDRAAKATTEERLVFDQLIKDPIKNSAQIKISARRLADLHRVYNPKK